MVLFEFEGTRPRVDPTAFIAPTATLVGDVVVEANASIWYGAVLRGDFAPIVVRAGANVQDWSVVHSAPELPTKIGAGATVAHLCIVHGATLGEECLVGNGASVLDGARVGSRAMIAAGAVVRPGQIIPDAVLAAGVPAAIKGPIAGTSAEVWVNVNPSGYQALGQRHRDGIRDVGLQTSSPGFTGRARKRKDVRRWR